MCGYKHPCFLHGGIVTSEREINSIDSLYNNLTENIGNGYILYSLLIELFGKTVMPYQVLLSKPDVQNNLKVINEKCSCAVLLLQDFIRPREIQFDIDYDAWYELLSKIEVPLFFPSLGINSFDEINDLDKRLSPELVKILKVAADKTELIGVRGYETQEVLHKLGIDNVRVIGCPSFFKNGPDRFIEKKDKIDLNNVIFTSEFNIDIIKNRHVVIQGNNKELWEVLCFDKSIKDIQPYNLEVLLNSKPVMFSNNQSWETYLSKFDFCAGVRLHGAIVALNSGTPAVCVHNDARTKELCSYLKIPYFPEYLYESDIQKIYDACDYTEMNKNYNKLYYNFEDFLVKSGLRNTVGGGAIPSLLQEFHSPDIKCELSPANKRILFFEKLKLNILSKKKTKTHRIFRILGFKIAVKRKKRSKK